MLRGLLIRQAFIIVDLALVGLLVAVAYLLFHTVANPAASEGPEVVAASGLGGDGLELAKAGDLDGYRVILDNGLFGSAAATVNVAPPPPPKPPEDEVIHAQGLKLVATTTTAPRDRFATAVIRNTSLNTEGTYYLDQPVTGELVLQEVHKRRVVLLNQGRNRREVLVMDSLPDMTAGRAEPAVPEPATPPAQAAGAAPEPVTLSKQELLAEVAENYTDLVLQVSPQLYLDENGRVAGITSDNLSKVPLTQRMGLQDGDVVQTVNGMKIDSEQKIVEIASKFQNLNIFRVSVLRNGRPMMITYKLE